MVIATILLVGIDRPDVIHHLREHGYHPVLTENIITATHVKEQPALIIIAQNLITEGAVETNCEHLRFLGNTIPQVVFIEGSTVPGDALFKALRNGTLEYLLECELTLGLMCCKMDSLLIGNQLNSNLHSLQKSLHETSALRSELSIRERIIEREQALNASIVNSLTAGLVIFDTSGSIVTVNDHFFGLFPSPTGNFLGEDYRSVLPGPVVEIIRDALEAAGDSAPMKTHKVQLAGRHLELSLYHMAGENKEIRGILMLAGDITEQEHIASELYQAEKLATVGTMLSGIAHELRNPLSIISARAQRALTIKEPDAPRLEKIFTSILKQTNRCATLVNNLLDFARNTTAICGFYPLEAIMDETLAYCSYQNLFGTVRIIKECESNLAVYGDRSRYIQVFLNILSNAADAMEGAGTITIRASSTGNDTICVEINDTGPGIESSIQKKIFDPFFTTRETGKGTGLGLAIAHKIVTESGGAIRLSSTPGNTSFFVDLPARRKT